MNENKIIIFVHCFTAIQLLCNCMNIAFGNFKIQICILSQQLQTLVPKKILDDAIKLRCCLWIPFHVYMNTDKQFVSIRICSSICKIITLNILLVFHLKIYHILLICNFWETREVLKHIQFHCTVLMNLCTSSLNSHTHTHTNNLSVVLRFDSPFHLFDWS